jgi:glycosyltransferase involved in cell wall biosynthesis
MPVRDGADLLPAALAGLVPAAAEAGGRVIVVDDASSDGSAAIAEAAGADVLRLPGGVGPYVARNAGWRHAAAAGATVAVFVDARCRPRPGWLPALLRAMEAASASMAAGDVMVLPRADAAGQAAARLDPLALRHGREAAFLPYAPTCHLAVRIDALEAVGGFQAVRGGGDVELCWRLQLSGHGPMAWAPDAILDWEPRRRVRDVLSQHHRYGANNARLCTEYRDQGCPVPAPAPLWRISLHHLRSLVRDLRGTRPRQWPGAVVAELARSAQDVGYSRALRAPAGGTPR